MHCSLTALRERIPGKWIHQSHISAKANRFPVTVNCTVLWVLGNEERLIARFHKARTPLTTGLKKLQTDEQIDKDQWLISVLT